MEPEKTQMWGFGQISNTLPPRPILDYFLKAFTSFMFQAVPQKSTPTMTCWRLHSAHSRGLCHTGSCHQLLDQQEQWQFQSPPHTRTGMQNRSAEEISRYLCICLKSTVKLKVLCLFYTSRNLETYCTTSYELTEIHNKNYCRDKYQF